MAVQYAGADIYAATFPLNVSVPVGSTVRIIFANGKVMVVTFLMTSQFLLDTLSPPHSIR